MEFGSESCRIVADAVRDQFPHITEGSPECVLITACLRSMGEFLCNPFQLKGPVESIAGGDLVRVRFSENGSISGISVDASLVPPEQWEVVEQLLLGAIGDGKRKIKRALVGEAVASIASTLRCIDDVAAAVEKFAGDAER